MVPGATGAFNDGRQHDAHEFLCYLLEMLDELTVNNVFKIEVAEESE